MNKIIVNSLSKVKILLNKVFDKVYWAYAGFNYNESKYIDEQEQIFSELGLIYSNTQNDLDILYKSNNNIKVGMSSCHHNLFVAFSKKYNFKNILEIGTHSGSGSVLLATLFPEAKITTIDLPDNHHVFQNTYDRKSKSRRDEFIKKRNNLLNSKSNINFMQINSLELSFLSDEFDLIWVDGAHGYPVVNIDVINSLRMISKDGFVVCDDVFTHVRKSDAMFKSTAVFETIKELFNANLIKYSLILKRTEKPWGHAGVRKYIAVLQRNATKLEKLGVG